MAGQSKRTRDHEEIRRWVEERGGRPAAVSSTSQGGGAGLLRIDFPGYSGRGELQQISWNEFFDKFDKSNLEFLYQEESASGEPSRFSKLVAAGSGSGEKTRARKTTSTRKAVSRRKTGGRAGTKRTTAKRATALKSSRAASTRTARTKKTSGTRRAKSAVSRRTARSTSAKTHQPSLKSAKSARRRRTTLQESPLVVGVVETVETRDMPVDERIRWEEEGGQSAQLGSMGPAMTPDERGPTKGRGADRTPDQGAE